MRELFGKIFRKAASQIEAIQFGPVSSRQQAYREQLRAVSAQGFQIFRIIEPERGVMDIADAGT